MLGSGCNKEVEKGGWLPLVRGSFRVDQRATLDANESGVLAPSFSFDRGGRGRKELVFFS